MQVATSVSTTSDFGAKWAGQTVDGRFPLHKYLGASGTGAVFLTQIAGAEGAKAVIKLVLASSCDAEAQLGFWRRAAKLSHPHLIRIFDGGRCWLSGNDLVFVVMEYADENLGEVLPRRALTPAEGDAMLRPIIEALKYLHREGLVDGHLRPSNVMAVSEQLKISSDGIRPPGEIKGPFETSIYDAPEIKAGKISPAADVWSLGATMVEALSHKSVGQNGVKSLPKPFADIAQGCLREDPAARWTLEEIEARLQGKVADARVASESVRSEMRPSVRRFLPLALGAVLLLILAAIYGLVRGGSKNVQPAADKQPVAGVPAPASSSTAKPAAAADSGGEVLRQLSPGASKSALRTIHGRIKVRVRVGVDAAGNVTSADLITPGPSKYFARLATQAAQQWTFNPPKENGQAVPSQWTILFEYTRSGISQQASQTR